MIENQTNLLNLHKHLMSKTFINTNNITNIKEEHIPYNYILNQSKYTDSINDQSIINKMGSTNKMEDKDFNNFNNNYNNYNNFKDFKDFSNNHLFSISKNNNLNIIPDNSNELKGDEVKSFNNETSTTNLEIRLRSK